MRERSGQRARRVKHAYTLHMESVQATQPPPPPRKSTKNSTYLAPRTLCKRIRPPQIQPRARGHLRGAPGRRAPPIDHDFPPGLHGDKRHGVAHAQRGAEVAEVGQEVGQREGERGSGVRGGVGCGRGKCEGEAVGGTRATPVGDVCDGRDWGRGGGLAEGQRGGGGAQGEHVCEAHFAGRVEWRVEG
ncbi:hypothetical protein P171DRAFT_204281 [Karstenula rhodostoma CBS 690.94]|uniref:Uncharacterized protein n=1 Tax=Karstenula rhodostoma CBS 690.94 TaxID=1392251 RepID=A0A9P4PTR6_9PLEO|nr:hypothetical protein P171DRAFT_204281 [Karstenula rhodostoma CBS 690.94]